jgi:hypothetical protein
MFEDLAVNRANHVCDLTLKNTRPIFCKMAALATMTEDGEIVALCGATIKRQVSRILTYTLLVSYFLNPF